MEINKSRGLHFSPPHSSDPKHLPARLLSLREQSCPQSCPSSSDFSPLPIPQRLESQKMTCSKDSKDSGSPNDTHSKRLKRESWLRQEQAGYEVSIAVAGTMAQDHAFANVSFPILCLHQVASAVCPITTEAVRVWGPGCSCLSASSCSSSSTSSLPGGRKWPHPGSTAFLLALARVVSAVWG